MAESVGLTATSVLPNDPNELLKLIVMELRVANFFLRELVGSVEDPSVLRQHLAKSTEISVT